MAEPRKASDVLLELESKIDLLLKTASSNDLTQKILSNKLSEVVRLLEQRPATQPLPPARVEAVDVNAPKPPMHDFDPGRHTIVQASQNSSMQGQTPPKNAGNRRTGRPEKQEPTPTHLEGDDVYFRKPPQKEVESPFPIQVPKGDKAEIIVPNQMPPTKTPTHSKREEEVVFTDHQGKDESSLNIRSTTIVSQRVVDKNGKVAFLADVNVINHQSTESVFKSRTSAVGKWAAPLPMGNYRVSIKKKDPGNNRDIEVFEDIIVDGSKDRMDLDILVMKELDLAKLSKGSGK